MPIAKSRMIIAALSLSAAGLVGIVAREGYPVPWEEAWALVDVPVAGDAAVLSSEQVVRRFPGLAALARREWREDRIAPFAAGRRAATRLSHPSGIRFAKV